VRKLRAKMDTDSVRGRYWFYGALVVCVAVWVGPAGCGGGYSNESLYESDISSVYVEMFDNRSFRRGVEYDLTDALAKRIEAQTPYKVVSDRNRADTIISGRILAADKSVLTVERETGRMLEGQMNLEAVVSWQNLRTGELLVDSERVSAAASYSQWQNQGEKYGMSIAANNLAVKIVEQMEKKW